MPTTRTAKQLVIKVMTQAQYDALIEKDPSALYFITDVDSAVSVASAPTDASSTYVIRQPNGLIQMGGIVSLGNIGAGVAVGNTPVVLPVTLASANYVPTLTVITDGTFKQVTADVANRTTTGFDICARNNGDDLAENIEIAWSVVGSVV